MAISELMYAHSAVDDTNFDESTRENTSEESMDEYESHIVNIVRSALVDESPKVRAAAATAFDALQRHIGSKAIDQTIPTLLGALRQAGPGSDTALHALKEIMTVSPIGLQLSDHWTDSEIRSEQRPYSPCLSPLSSLHR